MRLRLTRKGVLAMMVVILIGWYYPKHYSTCHGEYRCFGFILTYHYDRPMLNAQKSVLQIDKEPVHVCLGYERPIALMFDACNGSMGWFNKRDVSCEQILIRCGRGEQMPLGVGCSEWRRACAELEEKTVVPVKILDLHKTGIAVNCEYRLASYPGGEAELSKFINRHFQFPDSIRGKSISGTLAIAVAIDTTGRLVDVYFSQPSLHEYYKTESRRVLQMMPLWSPAYCDRRKVPSRESYLFHFLNTGELLDKTEIRVVRRGL